MTVFTVKEVAEKYKLTETYIREEIKKGNLKAMEFGRRAGYRINESDLTEWEKSKKKTS